jgi:hypothetical protein
MSTRKLKPSDKPIVELEKLPDLLKPIGQRTRSRRAALGDAKELDAAIKAAELAKKRAPGNTIKLKPLQMNPILEKDYKQGMRKKSSGKRESRSRSKSNSSLPPSEELNTDNSSAVVEEMPSSTNKPMERNNTNVSLPAIVQPQQPISRGSLFVKKRSIKLPAGLRGGRKKTAKRRRSKKSCGWF